MRIHTNKSANARNIIGASLGHAKYAGHVSSDVGFVVYEPHRSKTHGVAIEVQLGTDDKTSGPTKSRHFKNSGKHGADRLYAATYDEWGWFLSYLFDLDFEAVAGPYKGRDDFHKKTNDAYVTATEDHRRKYELASAAGRYMGD